MNTTIQAVKKFIPQIYWKAVDECCQLYHSNKCEKANVDLLAEQNPEWERLKKDLGSSDWNAGETGTNWGFFQWGWNKCQHIASKLLSSKESKIEELKQKLKFVDDLILRSELTNDQIHNIAVEFVRNNEHRPKDRILFFELGMREFRDKHFREEVLRRDVFNRNVCNNISRHADDVVMKSNHNEYRLNKEIEELKSLLQAVKSNNDLDKIIKILESRKQETKVGDKWLMGCNSGLEDAIQQIQKYKSDMPIKYHETEGNTIVRNNLMNEKGYSPYCGSNIARDLPGGCHNPRTKFNGSQFVCPKCGWTSGFPDDFIARYKAKWNIT